MGQMKFIFISHSNKAFDAEICERLYRYLSKRGICCWMDREDMHHGKWEDQIVDKIIDASAYILVESESSLTSDEVKREIKLMTSSKRPIIPFALDNFCLKMDKRMGSALYELGPGSLQTVFLNKFREEEEAFEKLISYLPHDITKLKNNPADFQLGENEWILKKYVGHDSFVQIPEYIREIADDAFIRNRELASVSIPETVEKIGRRAFFGCGLLNQVDGMKGVKEVDVSAFKRTKMVPEGAKMFVLNGILFGDELGEGGKLPTATVVAQNSFYGCGAVELVFEEGLEIVGDGAFVDCNRLQRITFPASLTKIGNKAFSGCTNLREVVFNGPITSNANQIFKTAQITEMK